MASTTILFGVLLVALGLLGYFGTGTRSLTALIPAIFGVILAALGFLARSESARKHAMHGAVLVALVGFLAVMARLVRTPMDTVAAAAFYSQVAMAIITGVFVVLCVRSFIAARKARQI